MTARLLYTKPSKSLSYLTLKGTKFSKQETSLLKLLQKELLFWEKKHRREGGASSQT